MILLRSGCLPPGVGNASCHQLPISLTLISLSSHSHCPYFSLLSIPSLLYLFFHSLIILISAKLTLLALILAGTRERMLCSDCFLGNLLHLCILQKTYVYYISALSLSQDLPNLFSNALRVKYSESDISQVQILRRGLFQKGDLVQTN